MREPSEWSETELRRLIEDQVTENIHLDYKQSEALAKTDGKKNELSKDVAAFANSDGGVLIYGMVEDRQTHLPQEIDSGLDPNELSKEWIESVINSNIQRRIQGVRIHEVRLSSSPGRVAYVVCVPKSPDAPHQSSDKRYYKRFNFQSVPMEDYEIRDVSHRRHSPTIAIKTHLTPKFQAYVDRPPQVDFTCGISLCVSGNASAKDLYVAVYSTPLLSIQVGQGSPDWRWIGPTVDGRSGAGFAATRVIHPGEDSLILNYVRTHQSFRAEGENFDFSARDLPISFRFEVFSTDQEKKIASADFSDVVFEQKRHDGGKSWNKTAIASTPL